MIQIASSLMVSGMEEIRKGRSASSLLRAYTQEFAFYTDWRHVAVAFR